MSVEGWTKKLIELKQEHLLDGKNNVENIVKQLDRVEANYPGGVEAYICNARRLLTDSKNSVDTFAGYKPSVPPTFDIDLQSGDPDSIFALESIGRECIPKVGFVLVAGGLGERLGYPDIKLKLFTQVTEEMTYIEYYCHSIKTCQNIADKLVTTFQKTDPAIVVPEKKVDGVDGVKKTVLPLFIMTSGDTHEKTVEFLKEKEYFGLAKEQVYIRQQEKVPALSDCDARIALKPDGSEIETKPHGHGDVHLILHQSGVLDEWRRQYGTEWLFFFQDTNCLAFRALYPMLGIAKREGLTMNSLAIPRMAKEAVGAICKLTKDDGNIMVLNVEYNQLDALLAGDGGDRPEANGVSKYPGNCNIIVFHVPEYAQVLKKSGGLVPEFVNPKYADDSKVTFKSPTRVECMMQDIPRMFDDKQIHGCTVMPRWFCFSTIKNCCSDAAKKVTPECAFSAEQDLYHNSILCLQIAAPNIQMNIPDPIPATYNGVVYREYPRVWVSPQVAVSLTDMRQILRHKSPAQIILTHDHVFYVTPQHSCESLPMSKPVALTPEELASDTTPDNYKVRGYKPARV